MSRHLAQYQKFRQIRESGVVRLLYLAKDWDTPTFRGFLDRVKEYCNKGQLMQNSRNLLVHFEKDPQLGIKNDIVVKKYGLSRNYDRFRFRFLHSKAVRSFKIALALLDNDLNTPRPIAVIEDRNRFNKLISCYYITEFINSDCSFAEIVNGASDRPNQKIIQQVAENIRLMHDIGITHNDLHNSNILIKNLNTNPEFYYIDLNRARKKPYLSLKARAKDFGRLKINQQEQEIFFKGYDPKFYKKYMKLALLAQAKRRRYLTLKYRLRNLKTRIWPNKNI